MKWATSELIHFDRVASAWLILRFVDQEARFSFHQPGDLPPDATPFGVPGVALGSHDAASTTFERILRTYTLDDPALAAFGTVVNALVNHVMHDPAGQSTPATMGLLGVVEGVMVRSGSDAECLERSLPLYDALFAGIAARQAAEAATSEGTVLASTVRLAKVVAFLRQNGAVFSPERFGAALDGSAAANH